VANFPARGARNRFGIFSVDLDRVQAAGPPRGGLFATCEDEEARRFRQMEGEIAQRLEADLTVLDSLSHGAAAPKPHPACAPAYVENQVSNLTEPHQHPVMTRLDTVPDFAFATAR
jgi:hypothetical protein